MIITTPKFEAVCCETPIWVSVFFLSGDRAIVCDGVSPLKNRNEEVELMSGDER
jgi:hypothetical protein